MVQGIPQPPLKISIVTPSFNQPLYLERTINSVLNQNDPNIEYVIIDGGSTDGSVEIIKKHQNNLAYWVSERDEGHGDALNKGFQKTNGDIMAWINSDDMYLPWTFSVVRDIFEKFPDVDWICGVNGLMWNDKDQVISCSSGTGFNKDVFYKGGYIPGGPEQGYQGACIQQESTFWRRSLWEKAGGFIQNKLKIAVDFELWTRFYQYSDLVAVRTALAGFRRHDDNRSHKLYDAYRNETIMTLKQSGGKLRNGPQKLFQKLALPIFGSYRQLRSVPQIYLNMLVDLHLIHPCKSILWENGSWVSRKDYIL